MEQTSLVSIALQAKDIDYDALPPSNLVFLIDVSGSMDEYNKLPLVQKAFLMLTENLDKDDIVSIVTYAGSDSVVLNGVKGNNRMRIMNAIENLMAGGSTAGSKGIKTAYQIAQENFIPGGNNRIILATDGDLNVGVTSERGLTKLIEQKREDGVFLSVLGFGEENLKDNKMQAFAHNGNGNYAYIDSVVEAKKVLRHEMGATLFVAAKDVKIQVEFNPENIAEYRLVGYEIRALEDEDFDNDAVDAGEVGMGQRVTALYEVVLVNPAFAGNKTDTGLKYQKQTDKTEAETTKKSTATSGLEAELLTASVRYKPVDSDVSKKLEIIVEQADYSAEMTDNLKFASAAAQFAMLLSQSEYCNDITYASVYDQAKQIENIEQDEYKDEFLMLVKQQARLHDAQ